MTPRDLLAVLALSSLAACGGASAAGPRGGAPPGDAVAGLDDAHAFCVDETNRYRAMDGKAPIARSTTLEADATDGAAYDTAHHQPHAHFSSPHNQDAYAENECPQWPVGDGAAALHDAVAQCVAAFYGEGPGGGHYDNLMGDYGALGCGFYVHAGAITIVQDYGGA